MTEIYYEHYGQPPPGIAIFQVVHTYLNLRIIFTDNVKNNSELNNPDNYSIVVNSPTDSFDFGAISVTPEPNVTYPRYIDIEMTDCTGGKTYTVVVEDDVIESETSTPEEPDFLTGASAEFIGVTEAPAVLSVIPLSLNQVKVIFNKYMAQLKPLYDPQNYVWTGGINTLKVEADTNSSVILTVNTMVASTIYDLTVG